MTGVQGDVAKLADLDRLYETVGKVKKRIDTIFANAGVGEFAALGNVSEEHFDKLFNINVKGTLFTIQKGLPLLAATALDRYDARQLERFKKAARQKYPLEHLGVLFENSLTTSSTS